MAEEPLAGAMPRVADILGHGGLIEPETPQDDRPVGDVTRDPLTFPADRLPPALAAQRTRLSAAGAEYRRANFYCPANRHPVPGTAGEYSKP